MLQLKNQPPPQKSEKCNHPIFTFYIENRCILWKEHFIAFILSYHPTAEFYVFDLSF